MRSWVMLAKPQRVVVVYQPRRPRGVEPMHAVMVDAQPRLGRLAVEAGGAPAARVGNRPGSERLGGGKFPVLRQQPRL